MLTSLAFQRLALFFTEYTLCWCKEWYIISVFKPTVKIRHLTDALKVFASFVFSYYKFYLSFTQLKDNHHGYV